MFKKVSIKARIYIIIGMVFFLFIGMLVGSFKIGSMARDAGIHEAGEVMLKGQKEKLKVATHAMALALGTALKKAPESESVEDVVREIIVPIRFEEDRSGYFFVYDGFKVVCNAANLSMTGENRKNSKDANGVYYLIELEKAASAGGGFVPYSFQKPGKGVQPKIGYAEKIPGTSYWVGSGVYIDNIEEEKTIIEEVIASGVSRGVTLVAGIAGGFFLLIILPVTLMMAVAITRSLRQAILGLKDIAEGEGDLTTRLAITNEDETGELARWINVFIENLQTIVRDVAENAMGLNSASTELSAVATQLSQGADEASSRSDSVAAAAEEMNVTMTSVAAASEQASTNVGMVAAASEEMSVTVQEIASNSEKASGITQGAVSKAKTATEKVDLLGVSADEISKVTEAITDISEQTNLLALNATIEAARAGEAGKGFAVVANEIKALAAQTSEATQEIKRQVEGIQGSTRETVTEIRSISDVIVEVNDIVSTIAASVEEQAVTTREISGNVAQAAQGIEEVNGNVAETSMVSENIAREISAVNAGSAEIASSSTMVSTSAEELSRLSESLTSMVSRFKV
ncbi:methyl-accepting chemotaxis protein [Desulfoluna butyratoxydans]|uniref:Methyl-accepting chemotaxis protein (Mcp) signalling domain n=1 Tax=Desulfoluna butyratoxydans TaxID=231438 RepID=A0A4U8YR63_9BACT|nr:methyl-accepting chemotaxis protein [Desulfoluna butyratoxydans]VFQ46776.1 methyl-accepting chemotaxis protein (mcp) signalling domain [Desulfoluna butyratoxydans]